MITELSVGNDKSPANLGSFQDVIYSHDKAGILHWSIEWEMAKPLIITDPEDKNSKLFSDDKIGFQVEIAGGDKKRLAVSQVIYSFSNHKFAMSQKTVGKTNYELKVTPEEDFRFIRSTT